MQTTTTTAEYTITVTTLGFDEAVAEAEEAATALVTFSGDRQFNAATAELDEAGVTYAWVSAVLQDGVWYWEQDGILTAFSATDNAHWGSDTDGDWLLLAKIDGTWQYIAVSADDYETVIADSTLAYITK